MRCGTLAERRTLACEQKDVEWEAATNGIELCSLVAVSETQNLRQLISSADWHARPSGMPAYRGFRVCILIRKRPRHDYAIVAKKRMANRVLRIRLSNGANCSRPVRADRPFD